MAGLPLWEALRVERNGVPILLRAVQSRHAHVVKYCCCSAAVVKSAAGASP